ncbi:MAG: ubiquitin-like small modifier protein 1 [Chloroflexota bacterium]
MIVTFYATLREVVGGRTAEFSVPQGGTVRDLLDEMVRRYPAIGRELLNEQGELYPHVHLFINGRDAPYLEQGLQTPLDPDAKVTVFPAVGGG